MFYSKNLKKIKKIKHCFFSRNGGYSKGIYNSLNCGIGSKDNKDNIVIWVSDKGPGIQDSDKEKVLDRFTRLDTSRNTSGTGLGLSLVASMIKFHKGDLELLDAKPKGLIVKLQIPYS